MAYDTISGAKLDEPKEPLPCKLCGIFPDQPKVNMHGHTEIEHRCQDSNGLGMIAIISPEGWNKLMA